MCRRMCVCARAHTHDHARECAHPRACVLLVAARPARRFPGPESRQSPRRNRGRCLSAPSRSTFQTAQPRALSVVPERMQALRQPLQPFGTPGTLPAREADRALLAAGSNSRTQQATLSPAWMVSLCFVPPSVSRNSTMANALRLLICWDVLITTQRLPLNSKKSPLRSCPASTCRRSTAPKAAHA